MKQIEMNNKKLDLNNKAKLAATEKVKNSGSYLNPLLEETNKKKQLDLIKQKEEDLNMRR